jgi:hypothetical protein
MKAFLLYRDQDLDPQASLLPNAPALIQDLELGTLLEAMALGYLVTVGKSLEKQGEGSKAVATPLSS